MHLKTRSYNRASSVQPSKRANFLICYILAYNHYRLKNEVLHRASTKPTLLGLKLWDVTVTHFTFVAS